MTDKVGGGMAQYERIHHQKLKILSGKSPSLTKVVQNNHLIYYIIDPFSAWNHPILMA